VRFTRTNQPCWLENAISSLSHVAIARKSILSRASGFANLQAFSDMIFLTVGDVDIPAQIPEDFRIA
jgi:hypothetical protein